MTQANRFTWLLILMLSSLPAAAQSRPSLRVGKWFRIDPRAKIQVDLRDFSPNLPTKEGKFDLNRARFGVEGEVFTQFEYQAEYEFRETFGGLKSKHPLRDAYVNFKHFDNAQVQVGKFKVPFSVDELTGDANLDFVNRSLLADDLAPARDVGVVVHGQFFQRGLGYEAGGFRTDGENSESSVDTRGGRTYAARVTGMPLRLLSLPGDWDEVVVGVAAVESKVTEGLSSLRGRTISGDAYFSHVYVQGRRLRIGTEASWRPGPFSIQSEYVRVSEAREGQSVRADNLPAKISNGWYITGTWAVTGESKENGIEPRRPFLTKGIGGVELAARYEEIRFGSDGTGEQFSSVRAPNLLVNSDHAWTLGVNWYLNKFARIQINGIQETIGDAERSPIAGRERFRGGLIRLQFSM